MRRARGYAVFTDSHDNLWVGTLGQGLWRVRRRGADYAIERTIELTGLSSDGEPVVDSSEPGSEREGGVAKARATNGSAASAA